MTIKLISQLRLYINMKNFHRLINYTKKHGIISTAKKILEKRNALYIRDNGSNFFDINSYISWIDISEPTKADLESQSKSKFAFMPKISVIVPTYNTPVKFLESMIDSVISQTYSNWELCIADGSTDKNTRDILVKISSKDERIKLKILGANYGIAKNTNEAIGLATGEFLCFLDHDDTLAPFAMFEVVKAINDNPSVELIYSDEDKLSYDGRLRTLPHFKPDWSPHTILSYNYITHLLTVKHSLLKDIGLIRYGYEGAQDFDLVLRATERAKQIVHIPKILYHWREHPGSTSSNIDSKDYVKFSTQRAVASALERRGINGRVLNGPFFGSARIIYQITEKPLISIIVPTKDQLDILETCIKSIVNRSTYPNYEIIIVDTGSEEDSTIRYLGEIALDERISVIKWDKAFNYSSVNNFASKSAKGEYLLFLNNDTEVQTADWIESMLELCQLDNVGAVGVKLLYPDSTIQHGGVILGIGGIAGHSHKHFPSSSSGYFGRLSVPTNLSAVTAACMMVRTSCFIEVGGFDEGYALAFNDVDLCLKIRERGYFIVWTPYSKLTHYESKTRGYEDTPQKQARFKKEIDRFKDKWGQTLESGDPYYNINLTLYREDFSLKKSDES